MVVLMALSRNRTLSCPQCIHHQICQYFYIIFKQQMNRNPLGNPNFSPTRKSKFKFYSPEKVLIIPRIPSLQKKKFSSPPHQSHLSPSKGPNASYQDTRNGLYQFQSFGTKSCARIDTTSYHLNIANQEDKKSNCSNEKKNVNLKMPNFLLSYSSVNDKKTQKKKTEESIHSNDIKKINNKIGKQKIERPSFQRYGKYAIPDIPKIDFSHKTSESSNRQKSPPYALSEVDNSQASNGKSDMKDAPNNQLYVPQVQRPKAQSLQKNHSAKQVKVPAFIRLKQQQSLEFKNYQSQQYGIQKQLNLININPQPEQQANCGFQIQINIKPAIKKRSFDDFKAIKELGTGSFGKACLAIQKKIGFICVIKIIEKNMVNQYEIKSLMREVKIQSFLDNIHITSLYGFFDDEQKVYLILQLLPSGNLKGMTKGRALPEKQVCSIIFQVLCAIDYMHSNSIIHRDIKPQNIFTYDNYMRLGDFGCAVYCDQLRRSFVGSPCYLSPEQLRNEEYDEKVDVWEIGVLTYELLFKVSPFEKDILAIIQGAQSAGELSALSFPIKYLVSEQGKDFMRKTLRKNANQRISIKQALIHPFVRSQAEQYEMLRNCHI